MHRTRLWLNDAVRTVLANGYMVDCSVTPHVSWLHARGATRGGSDISNALRSSISACSRVAAWPHWRDARFAERLGAPRPRADPARHRPRRRAFGGFDMATSACGRRHYLGRVWRRAGLLAGAIVMALKALPV